ncbi:PepSY domain-containing protein [Evansella sp. AB-P1]|uniref:PepSY domain-containing protein n=1 Tax=Evansella sp. AB-P1 TaxID=3037653 RepID=UPI00241E3545|nr:PepSY domain-containing protein [Evansella sp. AB-P1]MDG5789845.1 PepSY domain-containing protein [Evansella sp. AB-P1]
MKKNKTWISVIVGSIIIAVFGFGFSQILADPENDPLSTHEVTDIINDHYPGELEYIELEYDQGHMIYVVKIINEQGPYEIKVDALTGSILDVTSLQGPSEKEGQGNTINENVSTDTSTTPNSTEEDDVGEKKESTTGIKTDQLPNKNNELNTKIGIEGAKRIATEKVDGIVKEIELESDDGIVYYEIEMMTPQGEAELEINAFTGEIISFSMDKKKSTGFQFDGNTSSVIGIVEAKRIANERVTGTIKEIELDHDDGRLYYEIEMKTSRGEVEIEIDARTGEIISIEFDD